MSKFNTPQALLQRVKKECPGRIYPVPSAGMIGEFYDIHDEGEYYKIEYTRVAALEKVDDEDEDTLNFNIVWDSAETFSEEVTKADIDAVKFFRGYLNSRVYDADELRESHPEYFV